MSIPMYGPLVFLRCKQCGRKTVQVLTTITISGKGDLEETYECQECGETKNIHEFVTSPVHRLVQHSVKKGLKEKFEITIRRKKHEFF